MKDEKYAPKAGTQGLVTGVDDAGDLTMLWDNGSSLKLIPSADKFHTIESDEEIEKSIQWHASQQNGENRKQLRCPRCGQALWREDSIFGYHTAISRLASICVCSECGSQEAIIAVSMAGKADINGDYERAGSQDLALNIGGASDGVRKTLRDWWLVRKWMGIS
ncbi:MAG: DUF4314 domain-containing protein [Lachnospiraceae bacterium]|nr:DUF4314 domain-containing protein [Lachnospiraceae bacterium]